MNIIDDGNLTMPSHKGKKYSDVGTPTMFLTGSAGSGKSYQLLKKMEEDNKYIYLTASTGIAAMNIGAITIHSALKFGLEVESAYIGGKLRKPLVEIKDAGYQWLGLDEVSMIHKEVVRCVYSAIDELNREQPDAPPLGLMLIGDMAQLAPIPNGLKDSNGRPEYHKNGREKKEPVPWVFTLNDVWPQFEDNTYKLTKIWRQDDQTFLDALNAARQGRGNAAVMQLKAAGVRFTRSLNTEFDGTTLIAKNDEVDRFNAIRLAKVDSESVFCESRRWWAREWKKPSEWGNVPDRLELKLGAYVMILANEVGSWSYVNGDCGHIRTIIKDSEGKVLNVGIELKRKPLSDEQKLVFEKQQRGEEMSWEDMSTGTGLIGIGAITRNVKGHAPSLEEKENLVRIFVPKGDADVLSHLNDGDTEGRELMIDELLEQYYWKRDPDTGRDQWGGSWVLGQITYFPLRLAWASTVHKCLHPHTVVQTPTGKRHISELQTDDVIAGYSLKAGCPVLARVMAVAKSIHVALYINIAGQEICCSPTHKFPVVGQDDLVEAQYLKVTDQLWTVSRYGNPSPEDIVSVRVDRQNAMEMYDIEIDHPEHLFIADGVVTSNSQGLTLDNVQIDTTAWFFGQPGMAYVALSRCRTPQGITIVGVESDVAKKIKVDPSVEKFI